MADGSITINNLLATRETREEDKFNKRNNIAESLEAKKKERPNTALNYIEKMPVAA